MTICGKHDGILERVKKIEKMMRRYDSLDESELRDLVSDIEFEVGYIEDDAEQAKVMGQKMEDRLSKYRNAIEGLGFGRIIE
jgi:DnaJ-domain-containing protein 1